MKKIFTMILSLTLILVFSACGAPAARETQAPVHIANPYTTCDSQEEMEELAGFEVTLPEGLPPFVTKTIYRTIPGELVEVIYTNEDMDNEIRVRIAMGDRDISGVYDSDHTEIQDVLVDGRQVQLKGDPGDVGTFTVFVSTWRSDEGRTYSVTSTQGVEKELMLPILQQIH